MKKRFSYVIGLAIALASQTQTFGQDDAALDAAGFDTQIRPQDDLFLAVNGTWLRETEIPSDKSNYGSFSVLADEAELNIRRIIEEAAASNAVEGTDEQKVGDFYASFMDVDKVNALGWQPLKAEMAKIDGLETHADVLQHFGYLQQIGVGNPIGFFVTVDNKNSSRYLSAVIQSGTSLPDRDYYLVDEENYLAAREALKAYVGKLFELTESPSITAPDVVLEIETKLADASWSRVELRDANRRYNLFEVSALPELTPNIDWNAFFEMAGVGGIEEVNVMTPSFFEKLDGILKETSVADWQQYLRYHLIDAYATVLSEDFVDAHFEFHDKTLAGVPEQKPRWKDGVGVVAGAGAGSFGALGEMVGSMYVARHFPPENKERMDALVKNLLKAFEVSIDELEWMTDETKAKAKEKLAKIDTKIGYPDKWRDYTRLVVDRNDLFGNIMRSNEVEYRRMIDRLGEPVDRTEWGMTPQTVNAYYNPTKNEIVFPAAILQPPFFNVNADDAVNYGGIGAVIGHEISHGFDDQGSKYDGDGNLNNWWTEKDADSFKSLTEQLIAQYSEYEPLPGKNVNGQLTLGENIADLSGLAISFKAYKISLDGEPSPEVAGWSGEQRFFLGWSQVWRRKYREAEMVRRLLTDPHSPSWYRANGPVMNIDAFYEAFDVQPGDALYKPESERIRIW